MFLNSSAFYGSLTRHPNERTDEDVSTIYNYLRKLEVFERLHDAPLRSVCRTARLERHHPNYVLFRKGQVATCWYILLSGSVFMNKQVYLPVGWLQTDFSMRAF
uniref:Cyclic nucleotide-binding domain-containing protein n=1 Tax=Ditylenchus dipsaci TaxID=166011 RepID=A0A915DP50_9BILA